MYIQIAKTANIPIYQLLSSLDGNVLGGTSNYLEALSALAVIYNGPGDKEYTNIQTNKYTKIQTYKYTNIQLHKYESMKNTLPLSLCTLYLIQYIRKVEMLRGEEEDEIGVKI